MDNPDRWTTTVPRTSYIQDRESAMCEIPPRYLTVLVSLYFKLYNMHLEHPASLYSQMLLNHEA